MAVGEYTEGLPFCVQSSYLGAMKMSDYVGHRQETPKLIARRNLEVERQCCKKDLKPGKSRLESQLPFQTLDLKSPPYTSVLFCDMGTAVPYLTTS